MHVNAPYQPFSPKVRSRAHTHLPKIQELDQGVEEPVKEPVLPPVLGPAWGELSRKAVDGRRRERDGERRADG